MPRELERLLLHPVVLAALAGWAVNDHYLKAAYGNAWTGKLSDVASLVAAPVLLAALGACLLGGRVKPRVLLAAACLAMAATMAAIKLHGGAADAYRVGLAALQWPFRCALAGTWLPVGRVFLADDPSDVWALPAVLVPWILGWAQRAEEDARDQASA